MSCPRCGTARQPDGERACPECGEGTDAQESRLLALEEEFEDSLRRGESPDIDEYCRRHPELASSLRPALQASALLCGTALGSAAESEEPPSRLGRFELLERLGAGGMAAVYRASDPELQREVALKVFRPAGRDAAASRERFVREARALARIRHPHVVSIHEVGAQDGWCWYAMELLAGSLQNEVPESGGTSPDTETVRRVLTWMVQAADGLARAHELGVIHRDVKPANLLVDVDGRVQVGDFGLARVEGSGDLTRTGELLGTPGYCAPEQALGNPATSRSDVHGLGATALALLTGCSSSGDRVGGARVLGRDLRAVLERALEPDPGERYPDAASLGADLRAVLEGRSPFVVHRRARVRRVAWGLLALVLAAAALVRWNERPAEHGARVLRVESRLSLGQPLVPLEHRAMERLAETPMQNELAMTLPAPFTDYRAEIARGVLGERIELYHDANRVASFALEPRRPSLERAWRIASSPVDIDGDGFPELVISREQEMLWLKWDPGAWGGRAGWHVRLPSDLSYGTIVLADCDRDGEDEVLVADSGFRDGVSTSRPPELRALDLRTGRQEASWPLTGELHSTPRVLRDGSGQLGAIFMDADAPFGSRSVLHRIDPGTGRVVTRSLSTPQERYGTWPAFLDVDLDGSPEVIYGTWRLVGTVAARGHLHCLRADLSGHPLWSLPLDGRIGASLASDQDGDERLEACLGIGSRFACLRTAPGLELVDRLVWEASLEELERFENAVVSVGDVDGDGREDFMAGSTHGRVYVMGGAAVDGVLARLETPPPPRDEHRASITARSLAWRDARTGRLNVAAVTMAGLVAGWAGLEDPHADWTYQTGAGVVASPVLVPAAGGGRPGVLIACSDRWLYLLQPPTDGSRFPTVTWSFRAEAPLAGTPAVTSMDGATWVVFTDRVGNVHCAPVLAQSDSG